MTLNEAIEYYDKKVNCSEFPNNSDLISRQAVIDKINERQRKLIYCFGFENDAVKIIDIAKSIVIATPLAQPERKKGEWTKNNSCPFCGFLPWYEGDIHTLSFCSNCGSDMRGA